MEKETLNPSPGINVYEKMFFNVIILGFLYLFVFYLVSNNVIPFPSCISPSISTICASLGLLVIIHLILHSFGNAIRREKIKLGPIQLTGKTLMTVFRRIHFWGKSDVVSWRLAIFIILACIYLGFLPISPFQIQNSPPNILNFTIQFQGEPTKNFMPGQSVDVNPNEIVVLTANIPKSANVTCIWMTIFGSLGDAEGCATGYSPPQGMSHDAITVLASASCSTGTAFRGLSINVKSQTP